MPPSAPMYDVVGCGEVVVQYHAPVINRLRTERRVIVRACIDTSAERAARVAKLLHGRPETHVSSAGTAGANAFIATPPESHTELALAYLSAGQSTLLEKPFAPTSADARTLLDAARAANARVLVGHMRRLYPAVQVAREVVRSGLLGHIHSAQATEGGRWDWPAASSYVVTSPLGGVLYDTGSHVLDTLLFVLGFDQSASEHPIAVDVVARDRDAEPSHDFRARFRLGRGEALGDLGVDFRVSRTEPLPRNVVLHGERASLSIPGGFAQQPLLITGRRVMSVDLPVDGPRPCDVTGCFRLEHEALIDPTGQPSVNALLDGSRFVTLTRLLDTLVHA